MADQVAGRSRRSSAGAFEEDALAQRGVHGGPWVCVGWGAPQDLTGPQDARRLAIDDAHVYFTTGTAVKKVRRTGGGAASVVTLATRQKSPYGVAVDEDSVYFANLDGGTIMKLPK